MAYQTQSKIRPKSQILIYGRSIFVCHIEPKHFLFLWFIGCLVKTGLKELCEMRRRKQIRLSGRYWNTFWWLFRYTFLQNATVFCIINTVPSPTKNRSWMYQNPFAYGNPLLFITSITLLMKYFLDSDVHTQILKSNMGLI